MVLMHILAHSVGSVFRNDLRIVPQRAVGWQIQCLRPVSGILLISLSITKSKRHAEPITMTSRFSRFFVSLYWKFEDVNLNAKN